MNRLTIYAVLFLIGAVFVGARAQDKTPVVDQREKNQDKRIEQGVKSGELTPAETRRLEVQQGKINADEKIAKSDGKVTPGRATKTPARTKPGEQSHLSQEAQRPRQPDKIGVQKSILRGFHYRGEAMTARFTSLICFLTKPVVPSNHERCLFQIQQFTYGKGISDSKGLACHRSGN